MPVTLGAIQAGAGLIQGVAGFFGGRKAQKEMERTPTPTYTPSKSILDLYSEAKNRYSANPYQSSMYKLQSQQIQRGTAQGLSALGDRRMALGGVNSLIQGQNDAMLKAAAAAEQEQSQRFGQLGQATEMRAGEDRQMFNINQMLPYEKKMAMLGAKASGSNQLMNAGLTNIFGGIQGIGQAKLLQNLYSTDQAGQGYTPMNRTREVSASTYQVPKIPYY